MRILALDIATCTGFAFGSPETGIEGSGSHRLPVTGEDVGRFLAYYRKWLGDELVQIVPDELIFEQPVLPGREKTTLITLRKLYSLAGMTELLAYDRTLPVSEANTGAVCTHFLGRGYPQKRAKRKAATQAKCRDRGWKFNGEDEADALALLDYAFALKNPALALQATPLFGEQRL